MKHAKLALSFLICYSAGAAAEYAWKTDSITGCKAWAEKSSPSIRWEGQCKNGHATGKGVLHTIPPSQGRYEGEMVKGKLNGQTSAIIDGVIYDIGAYRDGNPTGMHERQDKTFKGTIIFSTLEYRDGKLARMVSKESDGKTSQINYEYQNDGVVRGTWLNSDGEVKHIDQTKHEYEDGKLARKIFSRIFKDSKNMETETYVYERGKLVEASVLKPDGSIFETTKYEYHDGKLFQTVLISHRGKKSLYENGKLLKIIYTDKFTNTVTEIDFNQDGERVSESQTVSSPPKVAERKTLPPQESVVAEESSEDSGIGSFLGGLLGAVSQYQQARGNTVKASQAEVLSAALSGDEKKAEAATSKMQSLAEAERARKAKEQADKVAAQEAAQLRAMQAAAARNSASSSSSYGSYSSADTAGGSDPSQNYPTQQQPTYPSGNTSSSGKRTTEAPRPVIDIQVIDSGSRTSYGKLKHFVRARNAGNVNVTCYVTINWGYSSAIYGDKYDSTAGHLRLRPGQTDEFVIEGENAHYRSWFEKYSLRDCRQS